MIRFSSLFFIPALIFTCACANLAAVRDFGGSAAQLGTTFEVVPLAPYRLCLDAGELKAFAARERGKAARSPDSLRDSCRKRRIESEIYTRLAGIVAGYGDYLAGLAGADPASPPVRWDRISSALLEEAGWDEPGRRKAAAANELARRLAAPGRFARWRLKSEILASETSFRTTLALLGGLPATLDRQLRQSSARLKDAERAARSGSGDFLERYRRRHLALREAVDTFRRSLKTMETAHFSLARRARDGSVNFDDPGFQQEMRQLRVSLAIDRRFYQSAAGE